MYIFLFEEVKNPCKTVLGFAQYNCVPSMTCKEGSELFYGLHLVWMRDLWHTLCVYVHMDSRSQIWQLENFSLLISFFKANYALFYWTPFFLFIIFCCIMKCMGFLNCRGQFLVLCSINLQTWRSESLPHNSSPGFFICWANIAEVG